MALKFSKEQIIEAIMSGNDHDVLREMYSIICPQVESYVVRNSGSRDDGKDVFQEAIIVFYNCLLQKKTDKIYDINGFILRVSKNIWINRCKKAKKFVSLEISLCKEETPSHLSILLASERTKTFYTIFNSLDEKSRQVLIYVYFNKLSMKEISRIMNLKNEQCARMFCHRSRQKFSQIITNSKGVKDILGY